MHVFVTILRCGSIVLLCVTYTKGCAASLDSSIVIPLHTGPSCTYQRCLLADMHDAEPAFNLKVDQQDLTLTQLLVLLQRARQQRSEAKAKKAEGQRRNTKVQQISNPATIKKMMKDKKQRKKLMTADPVNAAKGHA